MTYQMPNKEQEKPFHLNLLLRDLGSGFRVAINKDREYFLVKDGKPVVEPLPKDS